MPHDRAKEIVQFLINPNSKGAGYFSQKKHSAPFLYPHRGERRIWVKSYAKLKFHFKKYTYPINETAAAELKKRTLTNLYNLRLAWLANAHRTLDETVAADYGWDADISDDVLEQLLKLNQERSCGNYEKTSDLPPDIGVYLCKI